MTRRALAASARPVSMALAALTALALTGCVAKADLAEAIAVDISDDACAVATPTAKAGAVTVALSNNGSDVNEFEILEIAIRELSIEKGYFSAEDHRRFIEWAEGINPAAGARMVARAWVDPEYKKRVLADGTAAALEIGIDMTAPTGQGTPSDYIYLVVHENTPPEQSVRNAS